MKIEVGKSYKCLTQADEEFYCEHKIAHPARQDHPFLMISNKHPKNTTYVNEEGYSRRGTRMFGPKITAKKGWINIYKSPVSDRAFCGGRIHPTKEAAVDVSSLTSMNCIAQAQISYEVEE